MPGIDFGECQKQGHDDASPGDHGDAAQRRITGIEHAGKREADQDYRNGRKHDADRQAEIAIGKIAPCDGRQRPHRDVPDIAPEIADDRGKGGKLHGGGEGRTGILPAEHGGHYAHMRRRRDRQQFRDALNNAEKCHLGVAQADKAGIQSLRADVGHASPFLSAPVLTGARCESSFAKPLGRLSLTIP